MPESNKIQFTAHQLRAWPRPSHAGGAYGESFGWLSPLGHSNEGGISLWATIGGRVLVSRPPEIQLKKSSALKS